MNRVEFQRRTLLFHKFQFLGRNPLVNGRFCPQECLRWGTKELILINKGGIHTQVCVCVYIYIYIYIYIDRERESMEDIREPEQFSVDLSEEDLDDH
jgi:hypothetical protein